MNTQATITVTTTTHENVEYANLGSGDLAESVAALLKAQFAGSYVKAQSGEFLYYNGVCDPGYPTTRDAYQHLVDAALNGASAYFEDAEGYAD